METSITIIKRIVTGSLKPHLVGEEVLLFNALESMMCINYTKEIHNISNNQLSFNLRKECPSKFPHFRNGRWTGLWIRFHRNFLRIRWHWTFIWTILWQQDPAWNNISWRCFVIAVIFIDVKPLLIFQLPIFG